MSSEKDAIPIGDRVVKVRGRPKGVKNGQGRTTKWEPQEWKPEYEFVVALSSMGLTRALIAAKVKERLGLEYSEQHIGNILGTKQAAAIKQMIVAETRKQTYNGVEDKLRRISEMAADRLFEIFTDDNKFESNPMSVGNIALKILQGMGKLGGYGSSQGAAGSAAVVNNTQNNIFLQEAVSKQILDAIEASKRVRMIHADVNGESIK